MFASRARQDHSGQCWFSNYRMMEEKVCTQCKISRSLDKFSVNKKTGILNKTCTECLEKKSASTKGRGRSAKTVKGVQFASTKDGGRNVKTVKGVQFACTKDEGHNVRTAAEAQFANTKDRD